MYELTSSAGRASLTAGAGGLAGGSTPSVSSFGSDAARSIRVPVGFLWLLAVVVLGVAVLAYLFGVGRGRMAGIAEGVSARINDERTMAINRTVKDPLKEDAAAPANSPRTAVPNPAPGPSGKVGGKPEGKSETRTPPPPGADPREKGVNYLTLARPSAEQAEAMLAFCRAEGLAAYLVSDNNAKSRKLIVLPGLRTKAALETREGQELVAKVKSVGQRWKAQSKGNRDFSDAYLELFR